MIQIHHQAEQNRLIILENQIEAGSLEYTVDQQTWHITHTHVSPEFQGKGLARKLVNAIIEIAQQQSIQLTATCDYAARVLQEQQIES